MDLRKHINVENLHHAYIVEDTGEVFASLKDIVRAAYKNAEVHIREFDSLGVDDSRELLRIANMRSLGMQFFIYRANRFTTEAQSALLKLFEEPPGHTHLFLCVSGTHNILSTLRSRVWMIEDLDMPAQNAGQDFIRATPIDRATLLAPILKEGDVHAAEKLLNDVEQALYDADTIASHRYALLHITRVRRVMRDTGASLKILMESVSLITPQLS
jgi:hypothetical protein